jgi:hypothetical protein
MTEAEARAGTSDNGKADTPVAERAVQQADDPGELAKPWLHPDALVPRDYLRAKVALKEVLGTRSPYELLVGDEMYPFIIWCLRSRDDPAFTWDQALDTPFYLFRMGDEPPPPPTPPPASSGSAPTTPAGSASTPKRRPPARARSSAPSST